MDFGHSKSQPNKVIGPRSTKYEAYEVNRISLDKYNKAEQ